MSLGKEKCSVRKFQADLGWKKLLVVGAILFCLGMIGFLARRNMIVMFLCAEMMLQGVALNLVAFSRHWGNLHGQAPVLWCASAWLR